MARREALHKLQTRIAHMLQQASSLSALTASWLGVRIGGLPVLLPLQQSGEIYPMTDIAPMPYAKPWFLGVASLRGNIHGVVDLQPFLEGAGAGAAGAQPAQSERMRQRLVAVNEALGVNVVLRVDSLEGLRGRDAFERSAPPAADAPAYFGSTFVDGQNVTWQEINFQVLSQSPEFLDIALDAAPTQASAPVTT